LLLPLILSACGNPWAAGDSAGGSGASTLDTTPYRLTYVAVGASDAFGVGTDDPDQQNWPTVLVEQLGGRVHLINLGVPGTTVAQAQQTQVAIALDAQPNLVTVWLAVNDLVAGVPLPTYQRQLQTLVTRLTQGTHARIFVGNLPRLSLLPYFAGRDASVLDAQVRAWNAAIAAVCAATGATLVDLYTGSAVLGSNPDDISGDGLHPSTLGAQLLAGAFAAAIARAGAGG
jgi:lysophospholipase L1-like esterase